ncbi:ABC transporter permease [Halomonas sp. A020]|jgi:putative amino-acid transport system permease protein|nr:ABC transporter permease [Halomonas sp. A020]
MTTAVLLISDTTMLNVEYMWGLLPVLLSYLPLTLQMASIAMVFALVIACLLAVVRVLKIPVLNGAALLFISFFRGTPLLVQLFLFYYGLPQLIDALISINGVTAAVLGLTLHFSAYMAESIRAAIVGIDRSQTEAALSIGMTQPQLMRRIILPQATRVATPTLMNYFIDMIKATSLAFTLGVTELMGATQKEASGSFLYLEAFLLVAIIYWVVVEALSWGQRRLETYLNKAYQR